MVKFYQPVILDLLSR